jgi:hypothetical protein
MGLSFVRRLRWRWWLVAVAAALLVIAVGAIAASLRSDGPPSGPRAVIADQLDTTAPNQQFVDEATALLENAGYAVDYVAGEDVDVGYYRKLATHGYDIILLRTHAGLRRDENDKLTGDAHLFTSEPYSKKKYVDEQVAKQLKAAGYNQQSVARGELFFAIPESFVTDSMKGDFGGATVVLMGCDVFRSEKLAEAFVQRGASGVVGWDDLVSASHTDAATLAWLHYYLDTNLSAQDAAAAAAAEVGPDPGTGAELRAYP